MFDLAWVVLWLFFLDVLICGPSRTVDERVWVRARLYMYMYVYVCMCICIYEPLCVLMKYYILYHNAHVQGRQ